MIELNCRHSVEDKEILDIPLLGEEFAANMNACFEAFDKDGDGTLNREEFDTLIRALFRNDQGIIYELSTEQADHIFRIFDLNKDKKIDSNEFRFCWKKWIKVIVRPSSALLIVDVQNDFISGSLKLNNCPAQQDASEVIEPLNRLLHTVPFEAIFYSLDWHPPDHISFIDNLSLRKLHSSSPVDFENAKVYDTVVFEGPPIMKQRLWPRHCVQDSWGAELHQDLTVVENGIKIYKGTSSEVDSYSVFWDNMKIMETSLSAQLREREITDLYICGVAYDVCVGATLNDSLSAGYRTILIDDCCRGVDLEEIERTRSNVVNNYGVVVTSDQVTAMIEGRDRRAELGYKLAIELEKETPHNEYHRTAWT